MDKYRVEKSEAVVSVQEFLSACVDVPKFSKCCEQCRNYSSCWSCPPYDFDPVEIWQNYKTLKIFARFLVPENCTANELLDGLKQEKEKFLQELLSLERDGAMVLSCGSCEVCSVCARTQGEKCRHPEQCRYSIESLGGDVGMTAEKYFGRPLLWMKGDNLPDYMTLIGGILYK